MSQTDLISLFVALAGCLVIYLFVRNRESKPSSRSRNFIVILAIALIFFIFFGVVQRL